MKNPPHPGGAVLRECVEPLGLSITEAAAALGVARTTLSELVSGKRGISPEMAVRLSKVFGGSAESWLMQQAHYDLAQVRTDRKLKRLHPVVASNDFSKQMRSQKGTVQKDIDLEF
jgi:addiction module HigA family antidote